MANESSALFLKTISQLKECLAILQDGPIPSQDLELLQVLITNTMGYLAKDLSPDTGAL